MAGALSTSRGERTDGVWSWRYVVRGGDEQISAENNQVSACIANKSKQTKNAEKRDHVYVVA